MVKRILFNAGSLLLLCLFFNTGMAAYGHDSGNESAFAGTVTIDNTVDESCTGNNDGSVDLTLGNLGSSATTVTVLILENSTNTSLNSQWTVTSGSASGSFSNLAPGTYTVQFLANNSTTTPIPNPTFTIAPGGAIISIAETLPGCNGDADGSVTVNATGGVAPYEYSIGSARFQTVNTFGNLATGSYTFQVRDASGCITSETFTLNEPDVLATTVSTANINCNGGATGAISVSASGGTAPYEYSFDGGATFTTNNSASSLTAGTYNVTVKDANNCTITEAITLTELDAITASLQSSTDVSCNNGSDGTATFNIAGGDGNYSLFASNTTNGGGFSQSLGTNNTVTGLGSGVWNFTLYDGNGCPNAPTVTVTINNPDPLEISSISGNWLVCFGESATLTLTAQGGTAPYTYSGDGGNTFQSSSVFSNLPVGNSYDFVVQDANGCQIANSSSIQIFELDEITATVTPQDISCFGLTDGSINISAVAGGTVGYQYSIDGTNFQTSADFTALAAGNYTVYIKDNNNCSNTFTTSINEPSEVVVSANVLSNVSCGNGNDGSVEISATNTLSPTTYSINNGTPQSSNVFTGLSAGNYTTEVITGPNSCVISATFTITEPTPITATASTTDVTCNGDSSGSFTVTATGGLAPYTYSIDGGTNFGTSDTFSGLAADNYTIIIKDANDCTEAISASISEPTAITASHVGLAPDCIGDVNGQIQINLANGGTGLLQIRLQGTTNLSSSIQNLVPGDYTVETVDTNGCFITSTVTVPIAAAVTADVTVDANASGCGNADGAFTMSNPKKGTGINLPTVEYSIDGVNFQSNPSFTGLLAGTYTVTIKDVSSPNNGTGNCEGTVSVIITEPSGISGTISSTDLSCNADMSGTLTVSGVTGGVSPYTYSLDGVNFVNTATFSSLAAGNYDVTIRDNGGCTLILSTTLSEPDVLAATFTTTDISCNGANDGTISLTVTGGTAPYTFTDGLTLSAAAQAISGNVATFNAEAGVRSNLASITDANGCTYVVDFSINEPDALAASITNVSDVTCNGADDGTITIDVTGGTGPYEATADGTSYFPLASDGIITGIGPTTIANITVRDAYGCDVTIAGFTVNDRAPLEATLEATPVSCNGAADGLITIVATSTGNNAYGGSAGNIPSVVSSPYEYSIDGTNFFTSGSFNQLAAGSYTITVKETSTDCTNTFTATITEPDELEASPTSISVTCNGQEDGIITGAASGGTAPYEYSIDGGTIFQTEDFEGLDVGSYTLTVRDANGCTATKLVTVTEPAELVASVSVNNDVSCNGLSDGMATETVSGGTLPYAYSLDGTNFTSTIDLSALSAGAYSLTIRDTNGCQETAGFTITEPAAIVPTISANADVTCNGLTDGSFTVSATGGAGNLMFSLDGTNFSTTDSFTGLGAGTYTVTIQDGSNCTTTIMHTVAEPAVLSLQFESADITCTGAGDGQIAGFASGGTAPYTYSIDGSTFQSTAFSGLGSGTYTLTAKDANDCTTTAMVTISEPDPLGTLITSTTDVDCNGNSTGSAAITVTGGSTPYSYSLDGSTFNTSVDLTSLSAGSYTVTVRDANSCESTASFAITEPDMLGISLGMVNDVSCNGATDGSISVAAAGGTTPYQYAIDGTTFGTADTFSNLAAGNYTITLQDANGCTTTVAATVAEPTALALTFTTADISCNGGTDGEITPATTGGTGPYEYSLDGTNFQSGAFSGQAAGTYTLTVRDDSGCTETASVTLAEPMALSGTATVTDILCFGDSNGSITVAAAGGTAPYEYSTDGSTFQSGDSFSALAAGSYTVTIRDANSCTTTVAATVAEPAELTVSANVINDNTISVTASGGTAPYEYALDNGSFQTASTFSGLANGDYGITVRDANGCSVSTTGSLVVTGDDDPFIPVTISAYPNPVSDYLTFSKLSPGDEIRLVSLNGNSLDLTLITEEKVEYRKDISGIRQKIFLAIVVSKEGRIKLNQKVVKKD